MFCLGFRSFWLVYANFNWKTSTCVLTDGHVHVYFMSMYAPVPGKKHMLMIWASERRKWKMPRVMQLRSYGKPSKDINLSKEQICAFFWGCRHKKKSTNQTISQSLELLDLTRAWFDPQLLLQRSSQSKIRDNISGHKTPLPNPSQVHPCQT
jgi:hypothetical protein